MIIDHFKLYYYLHILSDVNRHDLTYAVSYDICHLASSCALRLSAVCVYLLCSFTVAYPILSFGAVPSLHFFPHLLFVDFFCVLFHQCSIYEQAIAAKEEWDNKIDYKNKATGKRKKKKNLYIHNRSHATISKVNNTVWILIIQILGYGSIKMNIIISLNNKNNLIV